MQLKNQQILATERIGKLLWQFSMPAIIGMVVQTLYNVVDTIFVGHAVGFLGIGGLSIVFPLQMLITSIGQMIAMGGASLISIALGAKEQERAELLFGNAFTLSILLGLIITIVVLPFSSSFLILFGASKTILPYAKTYMDIILLGTVCTIFNMTGIYIIRSIGNYKLPMYIMLASAILNTILDPILIFGLNMGIRGAAIATVISQILASLYILYYFLSAQNPLHLHLKNLILKFYIIFEIFAIGFASFIRIGAASITAVLLNHFLGFYGGDLSIAIYGIINRIIMMVITPIIGIAQGLQPIIGFNYGAKLFHRVKSAITLAVLVTSIVSLIFCLILITIPHLAIRIFTTEPIMLLRGPKALIIVATALPTVGFQIIVAIMYQSLGKAKPSMILSMLRNIIIFIPLLLILAPLFKLTGIWITFPIAYTLAFILTLWMFLHEMRQFKGATTR